MEASMGTAFCLNCCCEQPYKAVRQRDEVTVRGTTFQFVRQRAVCPVCGEDIYVPAINDANVQAREDAYRQAAGLITEDEIQQLLRKYNIGAGPLAKLLGFGEVTINRYVSGQLPSKQNSDVLLGVLYSHRQMEHYLKENGNLIGETAYKKCAAALHQLEELYGPRKIEMVARYLLRHITEVTPLALQKLLYYAQAFYYSLYQVELFTDTCQAWVHGPVFPDVYHKYKGYGFNPIEESILRFEDEANELTIRETQFLDSVITAFGCYSGDILREMTHSEYPWQNARAGLLPTDRCATEIAKEDIQSYFGKVVANYKILNPCDMRRYSEAMYSAIN